MRTFDQEAGAPSLSSDLRKDAETRDTSRIRRNAFGRKVTVSPLQAGLVLGFSAALVQAYFKVIPPVAYGVCMVCHPRDLVNWLADHLLKTEWDYGLASNAWPLLTVVGVVLGASVAAWQHGELRIRPSSQQWFYLINGFLMMNFGLILGSCPIRIVLLTAYGDLMGAAGCVCIILGVVLGTMALRWSARRSIARGVAL
jgi:hypothetical protein